MGPQLVRFLALCGALAAVVFIACSLTEGFVSGFYQLLWFGPFLTARSEPVFLGGVGMFGALLIAFSPGLRWGLSSHDRVVWIGPLLIGVAGAAAILSALDPFSPSILSYDDGLFVLVSLLALSAAPLGTWVAQRKDPEWTGFATYSLVLGCALLATMAAVVLLSVMASGRGPLALSGALGERRDAVWLLMGMSCLWIVACAERIVVLETSIMSPLGSTRPDER